MRQNRNNKASYEEDLEAKQRNPVWITNLIDQWVKSRN